MRILLLICTTFFYGAFAQDAIEVHEKGIRELQQALTSGQTNSVALVDGYLARIAAYDSRGPALNSLIRINPDARRLAAELDAERQRSGPRSLLHGIPIIIKDNYNTDFMPTTGGSVALAGFTPTRNAAQVDKLMAAGAIILAKSNLHEFAYGITSIGSLSGQTRNPYDPRRVPGGSSGGTSAAVAASFATVGMGSDTCGSIRIPSAFNNLVGLRPSKGLSSIYGIMPLAHTPDVAGPLARSVDDLAIVLDIVSGYDSRDAATTLMQDRPPLEFVENLQSVPLQGLRIGKLTAYFSRANAQVTAVINNALQQLQGQGVEIVEIDIPRLDELLSGSGLIGHEFKEDLNQYLALFVSTDIPDLSAVVDQGLFHEAVQGVLSRSQAGVFNEQAYAQALLIREELRGLLESFMHENSLDAIVYPPIGEMPVFAGESQGGNNCSISANSGLPAIALPAGFSNTGLPVGMELLGNMLSDAKLLGIAWQWEQLAAPRRAPTTTPALINGQAPVAQMRDIEVRSGPVAVALQFSFDVTTNTLDYQLQNLSANALDLYAVVLIIDETAVFALNDPVHHNLAGPGELRAQGSLFMSAALRSAWAEQRIAVKVFGRSVLSSLVWLQ